MLGCSVAAEEYLASSLVPAQVCCHIADRYAFVLQQLCDLASVEGPVRFLSAD